MYLAGGFKDFLFRREDHGGWRRAHCRNAHVTCTVCLKSSCLLICFRSWKKMQHQHFHHSAPHGSPLPNFFSTWTPGTSPKKLAALAGGQSCPPAKKKGSITRWMISYISLSHDCVWWTSHFPWFNPLKKHGFTTSLNKTDAAPSVVSGLSACSPPAGIGRSQWSLIAGAPCSCGMLIGIPKKAWFTLQ